MQSLLVLQLALSWYDKETIRFSVYHSKNRATLPSIGVMRCLISFIRGKKKEGDTVTLPVGTL